MSTAATIAPDPRAALADLLLDALLRFSVDSETELLTVADVCKKCRCGKSYLYSQIAPHLDKLLVGKEPRFTRASVDLYIRSHTVDAHGHPVHKRVARRKPNQGEQP